VNHPHERRGEIGGVRRPGPDKPRWQHALWKLDWVWRRIVPVIALIMALVAIIGMQGKVDATQSQVDAQREGRKVAVEVLCGGLYGVQEAGRLILLDDLPEPAPEGSQISDQDRAVRELYAQAYALVISKRVLEQAGASGKEVLRQNSTIDCDELKRLAAEAPGGG
jgi:hypothetical protein